MDAVLNWIWQGSVVAAAAAGMLRVLERASAHLRYRTLWIVVAAILVLPVAPLLWAAAPAPAIGPASQLAVPTITLPQGWWSSNVVAIGAAILWALAAGLRLAAAGLALRRARRSCRPVAADVESRLPSWSRVRATGRQARLVVSDAVTAAAVLGGRSPLIALAPSLFHTLTDDEIDRIAVHEWAHVQRRDDRAHLLQSIVHVLAGWHPAIRWCDRRLHLERETACDEVVVAVTGSTKAYAACLARLASLTAPSRLAAVGALSGSSLRRRVIRILALDRAPIRSPRLALTTAAGGSIVLGGLALLVAGYPLVSSAPAVVGQAARALVESAGAADDAPAIPAAYQRPVVDSRPPANAARLAANTRRDRVQTSAPARAANGAAMQTPLPDPDESPTLPAPPTGEPPSLASRQASVEVFAASPVMAGGTNATPAVSGSADPSNTSSRWTSAASAGVAAGDSAQRAAVATAGFFSRLGQKIADSF